MKDYLKQDEWNIIEEGFYRKHNKISESIVAFFLVIDNLNIETNNLNCFTTSSILSLTSKIS